MIALTALAVIAIPAVIAWRLGWLPGLVFLAVGAWGLHVQAGCWQTAHRHAVQSRPPVDFKALDKAERGAAREAAGAITGTAKIVGWLPIGATGMVLVLLGWVTRARSKA